MPDKAFVWECEECHIILPYQGCHHECPEGAVEEGFYEEDNFMAGFVQWVNAVLRDPRVEVCIVRSESAVDVI